ncbi:MAG TPA: class I SAM-dependent methyltransferase [Deltaproteobacteria bacterium]|nr:class I SAM-dependent methyltransferase [Deltaproteobacteria bacterium]HOI07213.1 class I SAM-dependent methyltransferase [Deltaproteobacteria bacterium]
MIATMHAHQEKADLSDSSLCPVCSGRGEHHYTGRDFYFNLDRKYTYLRCVHCGACYQNPMPGEAEIAGYYPHNYAVHGTLKQRRGMSFYKKAVLKWTYGYAHIPVPDWYKPLGYAIGAFKYKDQVEFRHGGKALDIGCANGKFLKYLGELGWRIVGLDFSENAVRACRSAGLEAYHGTVESAGFETGCFDLITARHVIEHMRDPHAFARVVSRIVKTGGRLLIRTPNGASLGRLLFGVHWYHNDIPRHLVLYPLDSLDLLFQQHGFTRKKAKTFSSSGNITKSLQYAMGNHRRLHYFSRLLKILSKLYVPLSTGLGKGDELFVVHEKR